MVLLGAFQGRVSMERIGGEDTGVSTSIRKVVVSSFIGTTIEWYDHFIYGTAAALVFPALFFPDFSELAGTLLNTKSDIYAEEPQERQLVTEQG